MTVSGPESYGRSIPEVQVEGRERRGSLNGELGLTNRKVNDFAKAKFKLASIEQKIAARKNQDTPAFITTVDGRRLLTRAKPRLRKQAVESELEAALRKRREKIDVTNERTEAIQDIRSGVKLSSDSELSAAGFQARRKAEWAERKPRTKPKLVTTTRPRVELSSDSELSDAGFQSERQAARLQRREYKAKRRGIATTIQKPTSKPVSGSRSDSALSPIREPLGSLAAGRAYASDTELTRARRSNLESISKKSIREEVVDLQVKAADLRFEIEQIQMKLIREQVKNTKGFRGFCTKVSQFFSKRTLSSIRATLSRLRPGARAAVSPELSESGSSASSHYDSSVVADVALMSDFTDSAPKAMTLKEARSQVVSLSERKEALEEMLETLNNNKKSGVKGFVRYIVKRFKVKPDGRRAASTNVLDDQSTIGGLDGSDSEISFGDSVNLRQFDESGAESDVSNASRKFGGKLKWNSDVEEQEPTEV